MLLHIVQCSFYVAACKYICEQYGINVRLRAEYGNKVVPVALAGLLWLDSSGLAR
jgi:hypothetical protein